MKTYLVVDTANQFAMNSFVKTDDISLKISAAITLTLSNISKIVKNYNCSRVVFCMEGGSWRRDIYPNYKAHRRVKNNNVTAREKEETQYFFDQTDIFMNAVKDKTNAIVLKQSKIEGDDFIARWVQTHPHDNHIILSNDSDFYQLISDNVCIYNPQYNFLISKDSVLNDNGDPAFKEKMVTVKKNNVDVKVKKSFPIDPPDAKYELFKKIIRGDAGDNIQAAYPKVKENGSLKKAGIREAYNDMDQKGYNWNSFMLHEWTKIDGVDLSGKALSKKVIVKDEFKFNEQLIDLSKQPDYIKKIMDDEIRLEESKPIRNGIGITMNSVIRELELHQVQKNLQTFIAPLAKV